MQVPQLGYRVGLMEYLTKHLVIKSKQENFEPKLQIEFYCLAIYGSSLEVATYMI